MHRPGSTGTSADAIIIAAAPEWGDRRKVLRWLLASLLVHVVAGGWWLQRQALPVYQAPSMSPALQLTMHRPAQQPAILPTPASASPQPENASNAPGSPPAAPALSPPQAPTAPLDLSLPELVGPANGATTENGAIVLDTGLLRRLQRAPRRTGYSARSEREQGGEFQAGGWVEYVRDGDRCFRVTRANALASADYDTWYRVPCPG